MAPYSNTFPHRFYIYTVYLLFYSEEISDYFVHEGAEFSLYVLVQSSI